MIDRRLAGQGLVEYALIIILVILVVIGSLSLLGTTLQTFYFDKVADVF